MDLVKLNAAMEKAEAFLDSASKARERIRRDFEADKERLKLSKDHVWVYSVTSKETAACRRASMEITRALAELRKP